MRKPILALLGTSIEESPDGLVIYLHFAQGAHVVLTSRELGKINRAYAEVAKEYYKKQREQDEAEMKARTDDPGYFGL